MQKIDRSEIFEPVERLRLFSVYIGAFTLVLVLAVAYSVARSITRPVVQLTQVAERIAQGDLNADITVRARNEIGLLAQAVSTMARSLKSLVGKVQDSAAVISANSVQMAASSRQQSEAASNTGAATVEVAAAAKQISATAEELARTMEQVNGVAQNTAQRAEAGLDGLHAIQIAVGELDQARGGVSGQLELIAQKAQAISVITVTMTKVADQTNLLSLNAAIEARRAGEYGRGFSVVAREIQRLADQAAVSTLEIEHTINEMAQAVATGVAGMKNFSIKVAGSIERIQTVSQQLTEVIQQVQGLPARFEMVLQGMQSQSEGARQITGAIAHMSESAQQTATVVQDSLRLIDQLRDTTHALQNEISLFKV
jgi:methyl-accepting chemotaxis protein WspA